MTITLLSLEEQIATGFSHKAVVKFGDISGASATKALTLLTTTAGKFIEKTRHRVVTTFVSANGTALTMSLGNSSSATAYGAAKALQGTVIQHWQTAIATPPTGAADQTGETEAILATFTSTGGTSPITSDYTAGEVHIFLKMFDPTKF